MRILYRYGIYERFACKYVFNSQITRTHTLAIYNRAEKTLHFREMFKFLVGLFNLFKHFVATWGPIFKTS